MNLFGQWIASPLLSGLGWGTSLLSGRLQVAAGGVLGSLLRTFGFRVSVVRENLKRVFPGETLEKVAFRKEIEVKFFAHLGRLVLSLSGLFGPWRQEVSRFGVLEGLEHWKKAQAKGRGVIFVSSHIGNWELMAATGALQGIDLMLVTKKLTPDWFHEAIENGRAKAGVLCTYEPRTLRDVMKHLARGGAVGFVIDQYAGAPVGVRVPFFGIPVGTQSAPALLAKRTGAPVLTGFGFWDGPSRFVTRIEGEVPWTIDPDGHREIALNTEAYSKRVEAWVRAYPDQWLWTHRRFKGNLGPLTAEEWTQHRSRN